MPKGQNLVKHSCISLSLGIANIKDLTETKAHLIKPIQISESHTLTAQLSCSIKETHSTNKLNKSIDHHNPEKCVRKINLTPNKQLNTTIKKFHFMPRGYCTYTLSLTLY